jgi:hypothetical protein
MGIASTKRNNVPELNGGMPLTSRVFNMAHGLDYAMQKQNLQVVSYQWGAPQPLAFPQK